MKYPFAPIDAHRGDTELRVIAEKIGVPKPTVESWRRDGLSAENADRCATAIGFHPWQLWSEMLVADTLPVMRECANPSCYETFILTRKDKRFCSKRCRNAQPAQAAARAAWARRQYATDEAWREEKKADRRERYATTTRRAELLKQRQRDQIRRPRREAA